MRFMYYPKPVYLHLSVMDINATDQPKKKMLKSWGTITGIQPPVWWWQHWKHCMGSHDSDRHGIFCGPASLCLSFADFQTLTVGQYGHIVLMALIDVGRPGLQAGAIIPCDWVLGCIRMEKSLAVGMYESFSLLLTVDVIGFFKILLPWFPLSDGF